MPAREITNLTNLGCTKELKQIIRELAARGWQINRAHNGHFKLIAPNGGYVFTGSSISDHRAIKNIKAQIKRAEMNGCVRMPETDYLTPLPENQGNDARRRG